MRSLFIGLSAVLGMLATPALAQDDPEGKTYRVYFLGGQSNMDGYGFTKDLSAKQSETRDDIRIFTGQSIEDGTDGGGEGVWEALSPGFGAGFGVKDGANEMSDRFGPELTFGAKMSALHPEDGIAIIKFSRGGTALVHGVSGYGSWDPDYDQANRRNQYDMALTTISQAMAARDIDGDGKADRLVPAGIVWMQGEADAFDDWSAARSYDSNLARLMGLLRAALHKDDLPIVIGQIKDSGDTAETRVMRYSREVRAAQARFVKTDRCASLVTATDGFGFIDGWHYRSQDYLVLGQAFADAMGELERGC
ncbi:sialate O-acetylesterase [Qipengyuania sp. DGS5-3]|uniref:sialate O-acetylesterase n=1 Tax=Qipengyuania sp. DGS5-3 TaxID=3349632 RepID=UPI0036D425CA